MVNSLRRETGEPHRNRTDHAVAPVIAGRKERAGRVKGATDIAWSGERSERTLDAPEALPENRPPERRLREALMEWMCEREDAWRA